MNIEIPSDIEAILIGQARAEGLDVPQYLERLLRREQGFSRLDPKLSPAELAEEWRRSVLDLPHTPPLSDEAISRETIYSELP